jgi:pilus assembly protein FimV
LIEKSHRWHRTAIAAAAIALLGLSASEVFALSLGRITVLSALGEPLRAEVEVPNISTEEAASLKANVASPAAFTAAGLDYNAAMAGLQATLARRSDGRSYIRLSSERAINEPFVDMILEASWSSGRIVRDYTMLFDPPSLKQAALAPTLPQTTPAAPATVPARAIPPAASLQAAETPPLASKPATPAPSLVASKAKPSAGGPQQVTVQTGDSASKLALRNKTSDVSLDQMLVALLRANPDAFAKGNLNRLRAGAVVDLPTSEQAKAIPAAEAAQTVIAQSKDFNAFRRSLADNVPKAAVETPNRAATGSVQAKVDDKKASSNAADKLTLSKGALQAKTDEAKIAKERADKDAATRAAELAKNIADLNKLSAASAPKAAPAPAALATPPASAPLAPKVEVAAATPVASAPVAAPIAPAPAPAPAASAPAAAKPPAAVPVAEPSLMDDLMEDPTLPLAGGGLLAILGGFALYRRQQNKKRAAHVDSSFLESRLQPDSFFGASGGQRVDTAQDGTNGNSSLSYTSSQLGAADDVDPVAEADVYLAYGRDVQAEEILKEAVRHNPGRLAIHSKLLDVYAKRRDAANFMASANTAFQLTGADSPEWVRICELGLTIDPENPLYQPGGASLSAFGSLGPSTDAAALGGDSTIPVSALAELPQGGASDLDLDLDFSAEEAAASAAAPLGAFDTQETVKIPAEESPLSNALDFDISGPGDLEPTPSEAPETPDELATQFDFPQALPDLSFAMDGLSLNPASQPDSIAADAASLPEFPTTGHATSVAEETDAEEEAPANASEGMMEFDLGSLSLDLGPGETSASEEDSSSYGNDSLETKLALAEEFVSIGDQDGARALIEEVVAEANGELREKAQRALASLS